MKRELLKRFFQGDRNALNKTIPNLFVNELIKDKSYQVEYSNKKEIVDFERLQQLKEKVFNRCFICKSSSHE